METTIRVAAHSQPSAVAGAIAAFVRRHQQAEVQAIGARAVNQMMKAAIIARRYLEEDELSLTLKPSLVMVKIHGQEWTAMRLYIHGCPCGTPLDPAQSTSPSHTVAPSSRSDGDQHIDSR